MNVSNILDFAIKICETGTYDGEYTVNYNGTLRTKPTYLTNKEWKAFLDLMDKTALEDFKNGDGDELSEKNGRPPKMACYGSSSRMIYNLSKDVPGFRYEKKLHTTLGGTANIDGFLEEEYRYCFVEAKCHEPYGYAPKKITVSKCYEELYKFLTKYGFGEFKAEITDTSNPRQKDVVFFAKNEKIQYFDIKQMICHLLGIATGILKGSLAAKDTEFIYLLFNPIVLAYDTNEQREAVERIYNRTCLECELFDFPELMRGILYFLKNQKYPASLTEGEINNYVNRFSFTLTNQNDYPAIFK